MKIRTALAGALLLFGLGGCASPYANEGWTGGYTEQQLEPNIWRVVFSGNGFTTRETVQTFWLYRAAETTLAKGYDGFEIVSDARLVSARPLLQTVQYYYPDVAKPSFAADIRLLKRPLSGSPPAVFDAAALKAALEPIVHGKLCDSGNICPHPHTYLHAS